jgi:hypothetical protein
MMSLKKRLTMKPVLLVSVLLVALLFGIGTAYAFTLNPAITSDEQPWAGEEAIVETALLQVDEYRFTYSADLTTVTNVEIDINNLDALNAHDCIVNVALYDVAPPGPFVTEGGSLQQVIAAGATLTFDVPLGAPMDIVDVNVIRIILDDLGV